VLDQNIHEMSEFFVVRGYRGQGVGRTAAKALFSKFCGIWHVAQQPQNLPAQIFWRRVIGDYTGKKFTEVPSAAIPPGTQQIFDSSSGDSAPNSTH
jgi:predicted acetyltransferase